MVLSNLPNLPGDFPEKTLAATAAASALVSETVRDAANKTVRQVKYVRHQVRSQVRQVSRQLWSRIPERFRPQFDRLGIVERRWQQKCVLAGILLATAAIIVTLSFFAPWISGIVIILGFILGYSVLISIAMLHRKRQAQKQAAEAALLPPDIPLLHDWPRITVLVPAHNEAAVIDGTAARILALTYPNVDLWIIDDRSTDATPAVLAAFQAKHPEGHRLNVYYRQPEDTPGKSAVLNEALDYTEGELVAVFDADAQMPPDFLQQLLPFITDPDVGGVQARKVMYNAETNWLTRCQHYEYAMDAYFQSGRDTIQGAVEFRGNGQLVKREAVLDVGGWNEQSVTDDLDLSTRFHLGGWDVRFANTVCVAEEAITAFKPLLKQRLRWAEGSFTRYLEYAGYMWLSPYAAFRAKLDMIAYLAQFLFPIWVLADYVFLGLQLALPKGAHLAATATTQLAPQLTAPVLSLAPILGPLQHSHALASLLILPLLGSFFLTMLFVAIVQYIGLPRLQAFGWAIVTSLYLTVVWVTVAIQVVVKILVQPNTPTAWIKTEHGHSSPLHPAV